MSSDSILKDWDPLFIRYFAFSTLRSVGYRTRVSVSNASDAPGRRPEPVELSVSLYASDGGVLLRGEEAGSIKPGEYWILEDVEQFAEQRGVDLGKLDGELLGVVHQTPSSHAEAAMRNAGVVEVSVGEIGLWVGMGDDFVEYFNAETGGTGGVFYQCPPMNDSRLGPTWMTVCQSPKVLFEDGLDSFLLLLNVSSNYRHGWVGEMRMSLFGAKGERIGKGEVRVPPFTSRVVSLRSMLSDPGYRGNAMLLGISTTCSLIPFGFIRDNRSMALAIDHTLPPGNYHPAWVDKRRRSAWALDLLARWKEGRE